MFSRSCNGRDTLVVQSCIILSKTFHGTNTVNYDSKIWRKAVILPLNVRVLFVVIILNIVILRVLMT